MKDLEETLVSIKGKAGQEQSRAGREQLKGCRTENGASQGQNLRAWPFRSFRHNPGRDLCSQFYNPFRTVLKTAPRERDRL